MSTAAATARQMLQRTGEHPVVSLFLDLDPSQFATAPARASQVRSLIDEAERDRRLAKDDLTHADRSALTKDLERLEEYLGSDEPPVSGARALAVFCSSQDDLFEAVQLAEEIAPKVVIATTPYVEPLVAGPDEGLTAVVLITRRSGRILVGDVRHVDETEEIDDDVHGRHSRGGWAQSNYERSIENDAQQHMRHVARELYHGWQQEPFARLVLSGTLEDVTQFAQELHNDLRPLLMDDRLDLGAESARLVEVRDALVPVLDRARAAATQAALAELENRLGAEGAAARGLAPTLEALAERRVETLLLARNFSARGTRCPRCGLLYPDDTETCPADGETVAPVEDLREALVEAAVMQDAGVLVIGEGSDPAPPALQRGGGIAALLRY
jgi:peptide subunit release factor 1 (eRF1)